MNLLRSFATCATVAVCLMGFAAPAAHAVTIDWVTVGDPGNAADTTGNPNPAGAVADSFQIMKFEFQNSQYADFLNAVDPSGTNPTRSTTRTWAPMPAAGSVSQAGQPAAANTRSGRRWGTSR